MRINGHLRILNTSKEVKEYFDNTILLSLVAIKLFILSLNLFFSLFIHLHLFIYLLIDSFIYLFIYLLIFFIFEWVLQILLIVNKQSNLITYIEFFLYKFYYV